MNQRLPRILRWMIGIAVIGLTGCAAPRHSIPLHQVLDEELGRPLTDLPAYRCTMGGHRGSSIQHRENSIQALLAAEEDPRYAFIEFDVQYTADNHIVVFHDRTLYRLFGTLRSVGRSTYAELLDRSNGEIPRYEEVMDALTKPVNIELKSQGDDREDERLADWIIADLRKRGRLKDAMISSISGDVIRYINHTYPDVPTGQIYWLTTSTYLHLDAFTRDLFETFLESQADYLMLHVANLRNLERLLRLKPPDKTIIFWDFDDRMYLVHQTLSDRLWGDSALGEVGHRLRYGISRNR